MAISLYFGLPGSGKATFLAKHSPKDLKDLKGKKYNDLYCNVGIAPLLPFFAIGIVVSCLLLGIRVIRGLIWCA